MYILLCANGSYYTGSTIDLERRLAQHQNGEGANHTKNIYLLLWFIMKNTKNRHCFFIEKNKFKVGVEKKKRSFN